MKKKKIYHLDIKNNLRNNFVKGTIFYNSEKGTIFYLSPELYLIYKKSKFAKFNSELSDIFSLGLTFLRLILNLDENEI